MISINQDILGVQCRRIKTGLADILVKPLENSRIAVCVFNKSSKEKNVKIDLGETAKPGIVSLENKSEYSVTDVWEDSEFIAAGEINACVAPHGVKVYIIR